MFRRLAAFTAVLALCAGTSATPRRSVIQPRRVQRVVYVADPDTPGLFVDRSIQLGAGAGDQVAIDSGLAVGESIVTSGSFLLRAERERLGQPAETSSAFANTAHSAGRSG